jgi:hypothetical protein
MHRVCIDSEAEQQLIADGDDLDFHEGVEGVEEVDVLEGFGRTRNAPDPGIQKGGL